MDWLWGRCAALSLLEYSAIEGDSPVKAVAAEQKSLLPESHCLRVQCKVAGEYLLKLNIRRSPIAHKYREGKLQRTLKRELKEPEIGNEEGFEPRRLCEFFGRVWYEGCRWIALLLSAVFGMLGSAEIFSHARQNWLLPPERVVGRVVSGS